MRGNGDQSSSHLKTRRSETPAVPSHDETQVKEEEFESLFSTSPVHFDNLGDDEFGDHSWHASETTSSLQPSGISRPPSHLDNKGAAEVQKLLKRSAELESRLKEEKTAREELVSENDELHKAQIQLQEQNGKLRATFRDLQEQYEEKCRQLRKCEKQHSRHSQQERVKQEHVDDNAAELQQPLQLQTGQRCENAASSNAMADDDIVSDDRVKQEALAGDEADDGETGEAEEEGDDSESYHSGAEDEEEEEDGSDSEEEDSDDRPSKRQVKLVICCTPMFACESTYIPVSSIFFTHRRRVSTNTTSASQRQVSGNRWSRRVTADNPHGFPDKVLVRLRAIEDPAERQKAERRLIADRRRSERKRSNAEVVARIRIQTNERYLQQKINAGCVILIVMQLNNLVYSDCKLNYFHLQLSRAHTQV
jgi:hypothetical protein